MIFNSDIFQLAGDRIPMLFADATPLGIIQWLNRPLEMLFGYDTYGELLGRGVDILVPDDLRQRHAEFRAKLTENPYGELMAGGRTLYGRKRDGQKVPVQIWLVRAQLSGTRGILAVVFDGSSRVL